jgi:hypothetical protein
MIVVLVGAATIEVLDKLFMVKLQFPVIITSDPWGWGYSRKYYICTVLLSECTVPEVYNNYNNILLGRLRLLRCMDCR